MRSDEGRRSNVELKAKTQTGAASCPDGIRDAVQAHADFIIVDQSHAIRRWAEDRVTKAKAWSVEHGAWGEVTSDEGGGVGVTSDEGRVASVEPERCRPGKRSKVRRSEHRNREE